MSVKGIYNLHLYFASKCYYKNISLYPTYNSYFKIGNHFSLYLEKKYHSPIFKVNLAFFIFDEYNRVKSNSVV